MSFEIEHEKWIKWHLSRRQGERKDALRRGHAYGNRLFSQQIWWPLVGHFHDLHPEYEVMDWRGRSYFVDFMWIAGMFRFVFEIMDYGSHGKDRTKYRMDLNRGLFLQSQQYDVISISLDEIKENPSFVLAIVRNILAPYLVSYVKHAGHHVQQFGKIERQLMRYAVRHNRLLRPSEASMELELHKQTVIKYCRELVSKGTFRAISAGISGKVYHYEYLGTVQSLELL